jgi:predicted ATP-dependent endonuclease of OLD family
MYTSIHVKNFRGLEDLRVEDLRRINLIVGKNNTGKTSLLEAVLLLCWPTKPALTLTLGTMRGQAIDKDRPDPEPIWRALFHGLDHERPIEISGERHGKRRTLSIQAALLENEEEIFLPDEPAAARTVMTLGGIHRIRLRYEPEGGEAIEADAWLDPGSRQIKRRTVRRDDDVPGILLSARANVSLPIDIDRFSDLLREKHEGWVRDALRLLDARLEKLAVVTEAAGPAMYADVGLSSLLPLSVCGEGMVRLFSIVVELAAQRGGLLLVDEIDNGLHHSVMLPFWGALGKLAEELDVQIFATTHNDEIIQSAIEAFSADPSALCLYRLDRRDSGVTATRYSERVLAAAEEANFEVRG